MGLFDIMVLQRWKLHYCQEWVATCVEQGVNYPMPKLAQKHTTSCACQPMHVVSFDYMYKQVSELKFKKYLFKAFFKQLCVWTLNFHSNRQSIEALTHWDPSQSSWAAQGPAAPYEPHSWILHCNGQGTHHSSGDFHRSWSWSQHQHLHGDTGGGLWML